MANFNDAILRLASDCVPYTMTDDTKPASDRVAWAAHYYRESPCAETELELAERIAEFFHARELLSY